MFVNTLGKCRVVKILKLRKMLRKGKKTASQSGTVRGSRKEAVGGDPLS